MHLYDIWIDLECAIDGERKVVCTMIAKLEFPVRPVCGERITFWSSKDTPACFDVITVLGAQSHHYISMEIEDLSHHFHPNAAPTTSVRGTPVLVATIDDAQRVVAFLSAQHGFELDPYSPKPTSQVATSP